MSLTSRVISSCLGCGVTLIVMACFAVSANAAPVGEAEVKQCVQDILQRSGGGACSNYFSLESVKKVDARETSNKAFVIADVTFRVKQRVGGASQAANVCTGSEWSVKTKNPYPPNTGAWFMYQSQADMEGGYLEPGWQLKVRKTFKFEHWESGWRCAATQMIPLDLIWPINATQASSVPAPSAVPSGSARVTANCDAAQAGEVPLPPVTVVQGRDYYDFEAGSCHLLVAKGAERGGKMTWSGPCNSRGYAEGDGIWRSYDASGCLVLINKARMEDGRVTGSDGVFAIRNGQIVGNRGIVEPRDVPAWARGILGSQ